MGFSRHLQQCRFTRQYTHPSNQHSQQPITLLHQRVRAASLAVRTAHMSLAKAITQFEGSSKLRRIFLFLKGSTSIACTRLYASRGKYSHAHFRNYTAIVQLPGTNSNQNGNSDHCCVGRIIYPSPTAAAVPLWN